MKTLKQVHFTVNRVLKLVFCVLLLQGVITPIFAISDEEVLSRALKLYNAGKSATDVAKELIRSGASLEQLQALQTQFGGQLNKSKTATTTTNTKAVSTQRTNKIAKKDTTQQEKNDRSKEGQIFGHELFSQAFASMQPQMNVPTPQDYVLGSGDMISINFYGSSNEAFQVEISPDGVITIPDYGPIYISGLTISAASRKIKSTLGARYQNSQMMLTLGQARSITINVMGEVTFPGSYQVTAFSDVLYSIYMAGGITETGTLRAIKVYRNSNLVSTVDLYQYLMNGSTKTNIRLQDGDVVLVGTYSELVCAKGSVKRPIFFELLSNETIHNLLYYAGGFEGDAYTDAVRVYRRHSSEGYSVHTVANAEFDKFRLMDGDTVEIEAILDRPQNTLEIQGAVFRPGFYGLSGNLHTIKQLVEMAHGPLEQAVAERSVLYRMKFDRTYEVIQVDVQAILQGIAPDMELNNEDRLFVPSRERQLDHFTITIHGEVYEPGTYPYALNETVENIVLRAGGLTDRASTNKVHIIRHLIDPSATEEPEKNTMLFSLSLEDTAQVASFFLEPFDEIYIRNTPAYAPPQNVFVRGEVLYDGAYALKTKSDRISSIIAAAGGLTRYAYPEGARLIRKMNEEEQRHMEQMMKINATSSTSAVNENLLDTTGIYYIAINLPEALAHPGGPEDFILRDSDVLIVPTITTTVHIDGEVLFPNSVTYIHGKKAKYYIEQAGGYSNMARKSKTYIIFPNGKVAKASKASVMPGCEIIIPSKPARIPMTATQWISVASATASLASVAATLATLIINATKK